MIWLLLLLAVLVLQPVIIGLSEHRNPEKALAWIFVATLLPLAGLILFYYIEKEFRPQQYSLQSVLSLPSGPNGTGTLPCSSQDDVQHQEDARQQAVQQQSAQQQSAQQQAVRQQAAQQQSAHQQAVQQQAVQQLASHQLATQLQSAQLPHDAQQQQSARQVDAQQPDAPCDTRGGAAVLLRRLPPSPVIGSSRTEVLTDGAKAFQVMLDTMERAKDHIHVEFYTIRDDGIGTKFQRLWIRKARQGVKVRILYDGLGSKDLSDSYVQALREEGVDIRCFLPPRTFFRAGRINHRNHRKVAVVDGRIGFLGGLNIGDEYVGKHPELGYWRDTHLKLEGAAVRELERLFLHDWASASGERLDELHRLYLDKEREDGWTDGSADGRAEGSANGSANGRANGRMDGKAEGSAVGSSNGRADGSVVGRGNGKAEGSADGSSNGRMDGEMPGRHAGLPDVAKRRAQTDDADEPVQLIASGPDTGEPGILYGYLCLLHSARRHILWTTPYFIPDAAVCKALKSAVLFGVDVRILLPYKPDHRLVQLASMSYVKELLQAGIRFYLYKKGFIHAKTLVVDDTAAAVGTANLDLRSLYKNYELTAFLYHPRAIRKLKDDFVRDLRESEELRLDRMPANWRRGMAFSALTRVLSPLL